MMCRVVLLERRLASLEGVVEGYLQKCGRALNLKGSLEVYLVGSRTAPEIRGHKNFDILSFPAPSGFPRPDLTSPFYGEIYINPDVIRKQKGNFKALLIHGFLHLVGYDHIKKSDRIRMERKENQLILRTR